jgi:site-specific recombinase XerD
MSRSSTTANSPIESLLDGFVGYLREERGVSAATAETYVPDLRRFLAQHGQQLSHEPSIVPAGWHDAAPEAKSRHRSRPAPAALSAHSAQFAQIDVNHEFAATRIPQPASSARLYPDP